jgi:uracil-DNA glycosylase family 4
MGWTERQRAMLAEMGLRTWDPQPGPLADAEPAAQLGAEPSAAPVPPLAPPPSRPLAVARALPGGTEAPMRMVPPERTGSRPEGVGQMDWSALREAVAGCSACKLCTGRTQTVFGVGNTRSQWMVVGEAPGEQEDRQGEPFVGKSGQLLDNMLRAIRVTRSDAPLPDGSMPDPAHQVFIANTVKCRPPGNRNPEPEELAQCEPFLIRQIELLQPRIILAMGRFAVQSLLRSTEPIGRLRGRVHRYQGVPLIVTYHPAYLLRNLEDKAKAWDDLCLARDVAAGTVAT